MTMTKRDLARAVAQEAGGTAALALAIVDALFAGMRVHLIEGNRIEIRGFGVLDVKDAAAKPQARNPRTGEITPVPARRKAHFRPGKLLAQGLHKSPPRAKKSPQEERAVSLREAITTVLKRRRNRWMTYDEIAADIERLGVLALEGDTRTKVTAQVSQYQERFEKEPGRPVRVRLSAVGLTRPLPKTTKKGS